MLKSSEEDHNDPLPCIANTMVADDLTMQGARTSAAIIGVVLPEYSGSSTRRVNHNSMAPRKNGIRHYVKRISFHF